MAHVSVDTETLGTTPGSVICSIGAVAFDPDAGMILDRFYRTIDVQSAQRLGLTIDADAVLWWLQQSDAARAALTELASPLPEVLAAFSHWWQSQRGDRVWCHGANFDEPILAAAYRACGLRTPWKYWASRCTRTIFDLAGVQPDRTAGEHHNALDDALAQAEAVCEAYRQLGLVRVLVPETTSEQPA